MVNAGNPQPEQAVVPSVTAVSSFLQVLKSQGEGWEQLHGGSGGTQPGTAHPMASLGEGSCRHRASEDICVKTDRERFKYVMKCRVWFARLSMSMYIATHMV